MGDTPDDLPYRAEYAKSGRAKCKACKVEIPKGDMRLAAMVQSPFFDGKQANWFHWNCFFMRNRPAACGEIAHFDSLRWEDQEKINKRIEEGPGAALVDANGKKGKGKKGGKGAAGQVVDGTLLGDFRTEYAKSGAAKCRKCEEKIKKGEVRICKKDYDDDRAKQYGPLDRWYMVDCFAEAREEMVFFCAADQLPGFNTLSKDDQDMLLKKLPKVKRKLESNGKDEPDSKKVKLEVKDDPAEAALKSKMKKQNTKMFYYRDLLKKHLKKQDLYNLLEHNKQDIPTGEDSALDRLCDIMTFGALERCKECGNGQFVYQSGVGYRCQGDMSEWTKCSVVSQDPARRDFKVPKDYKQEHDFLSMYQPKTGTRVIPNLPGVPKSSNSSNSHKEGQGTSTSALLPLQNMKFVLSGKMDKEKYQGKIEALGGKVSNSVTKETIALISDKDTLKENRSKVKDARKEDVPVITKEFLAGVKTEGVVSMVRQFTISEWGREPDTKIQKARADAEKKQHGSLKSSASRFISQAPKSVKLKLKGGAYVDPDSELENKAHVLKSGENLYTAVLGSVNIQDGKNSYYKIQVLEHDQKRKWYVFRSWGRVGTTIGGTKLEDFEDKHEAVKDFEFLYEEKTGNRWKNRKDFKKVAGKFYPLDIDMGESNDDLKKLSLKDSKSKLAKSIQELVTLIFDIERMRSAMVEFEIDLTKMPLGKLSQKQIDTAYKILTEVQDMIKNVSGSEAKFLDASNRFFTLIPHDFGMKSPPLLDNPDLVKTKIEMLENLKEIDLAFNLLSTGGEDKGKDPIDSHYDKLKTEIDVLDRESEEWSILSEYVKNTHASTHTQYSLEIEEIFKVSRKGESKRFKPFKALPNRKLLWHGSRTTNFAGILSQGLRIAPPEAPVTGYMFGKGIYFADMVSKSANYCCTNRTNNTGLMLLCDVALGNMYEATKAEYVEKLPTGFHSTKGLGKTAPDPASVKEIDGSVVPIGVGVKDTNLKTDLLYNEFIVYDVAQVNAKYLFRMKFNYKI